MPITLNRGKRAMVYNVNEIVGVIRKTKFLLEIEMKYNKKYFELYVNEKDLNRDLRRIDKILLKRKNKRKWNKEVFDESISISQYITR